MKVSTLRRFVALIDRILDKVTMTPATAPAVKKERVDDPEIIALAEKMRIANDCFPWAASDGEAGAAVDRCVLPTADQRADPPWGSRSSSPEPRCASATAGWRECAGHQLEERAFWMVRVQEGVHSVHLPPGELQWTVLSSQYYHQNL